MDYHRMSTLKTADGSFHWEPRDHTVMKSADNSMRSHPNPVFPVVYSHCRSHVTPRTDWLVTQIEGSRTVLTYRSTPEYTTEDDIEPHLVGSR